MPAQAYFDGWGTFPKLKSFVMSLTLPSTIAAIDRLRLFLRPPGLGLYAKGSTAPYAARLLEMIYGGDSVSSAWEDSLQRLRRVNTLLLGVPSGTGASGLPGSQLGPIAVREAYLKHFSRYPKNLVDVGDVVCVPSLLHDVMLDESQKTAVRAALYPGRPEPLPVSPLSITEQVLAALFELNPDVRVFTVGGDHGGSWPVLTQMHRRYGDELGVLQLDSRPDMADSRMGVKYCASTWAFHAVRLLRPHTMVQVGISQSSRPKEYWMAEFPMLQIWTSEIEGRESEIIVKIAQHFQNRGVTRVYLTHDIEATQLSPGFIFSLIRHLREKFPIVGGDAVEVSPPLSWDQEIFSGDKSCLFAAQFLKTLLE